MYNSRFFTLKLINFQKKGGNVDISTYGTPSLTPKCTHNACALRNLLLI